MKGDDGGYYIPNIDEEGILTWIPSEEGMEPVEEQVAVIGPKGEPGEPGFYVGTEEPENQLVWINPEGTKTSDFATVEYVDAEIAKINVPDAPDIDLEGYATIEYVDGAIAAIPETDLSEYAKLEDIPDTSGYALKSEIPDTSNLALKSEIPDTSAFITADDLPDTSGFTTEDEVNTLINTALGVVENGTY